MRRFLALGLDGRERLDHPVEHVAGAQAVEGAHGDGVAQVESVELDRVEGALGVVALVDRQHHPSGHGAQDLGHFGVGGGQTFAPVYQKDDRIGLFDGVARLFAGAAVQFALGQAGIFGAEEQPRRVHHGKLAPVPETLAIEPVAGRARHVFDNRPAFADQPVEKR